MNKPLKVNDIFQDLKVTRVTESFCFFGKKRISWNRINKMIESGEKIQFEFSPNVDLDWTNLKEIKEYYNSFVRWDLYISNGDLSNSINEILEVKNGVVFYKGEYYLPAPISNVHIISKNNNVIDGLYNVILFKKLNCWYSTMKTQETITVNVFLQGSRVLELNDLKNNRDEIYAYPFGDRGIGFEYTRDFWYGVSITNFKIDLISFFKEYYIKKRFSKELNLTISDLEIQNLLFPIKKQIENILEQCRISESFTAEIDVDIIRNIKLDSRVCNEIFNIINNHLSK